MPSTEWLALPASGESERPLTDWTEAFARHGHPATVEREGPEAAWIEVTPLRLRGYAVLAGTQVEAINFEFHDPEPAEQVRLVGQIAAKLGWELHPDEEDEDDDND